MNSISNNLHILLDNGHGKNTPGKRSPVWEDGTQLFEYEFNRYIVNGIARKLSELDIPYEIVVPEETDISLSQRVKRIKAWTKQYGAKNCLVVSVHANAGGGTGWECFTTKGQTTSDLYAEIFCDTAETFWKGKFKMRWDLSDGDKDKEEQFTIIYGPDCPALLTENFFMDTYTDCRYIMTEEGRNDVIEMHVEAIKKCVDYWQENFNKTK